MKRVVITGMGAVTPLGLNLPETWKNVITGVSGPDYITLFDASSFPVKIASEVKGLNFNTRMFPETDLTHAGRNTQMAVIAAKEAVADAAITPVEINGDRFGIYLGSGESQMDFYNFVNLLIRSLDKPDLCSEVSCVQKIKKDIFLQEGSKFLHPVKELEQEPFMASQHLARIFGACGPNFSCLTACAAGSQAIAGATQIIRKGDADIMISGGCHSMIHPFGLTGFILLSALSMRNDEPKRASRPFDRERDGFVLGEGAGILVLEEYTHAIKRGAKIYGEILGYGISSDAFRITDIHPEGRGAVQCMESALNNAGVTARDIDYINTHGTSTQVNDRVESLSIRTVFKEYAKEVWISSTKSMTGHLIAAAGAVELEFCILAINNGIVPPTINYENPDPDCDLYYVPNKAREKNVKLCLSNSFGFGGQNVSLVVGSFS